MLAWGGFWLLTLIWGSLYMLSRVGLEVVDPLHIVFIRLGIASLGLNLIVILRRMPIPKDLGTILKISLNGIGSITIPMVLLNWGLQYIESGLGSVLQASAALFAVVVAHFFFVDERLTPSKLIGVVLGFIGVIALASRTSPSASVSNSFAGQIAVIVSALSYALFTIHSRTIIQQNIQPLVLSSISMLAATLAVGVLMFIATAQGQIPAIVTPDLSLQILLIILILSLFQSFLAYLIYYEVVARLGASQATMVTYVTPPVALILGIVFLNERLDTYIIIGTTLIFTGILFTRLNLFNRIKLSRARI